MNYTFEVHEDLFTPPMHNIYCFDTKEEAVRYAIETDNFYQGEVSITLKQKTDNGWVEIDIYEDMEEVDDEKYYMDWSGTNVDNNGAV